MSYLAEWQTAKKTFETATGKKKPSDGLMGVFRKSSGLEAACKGLDDALKKPSHDGLAKAMLAFEKARQAYLPLLEGADKKEKTVHVKTEIDNLKKALAHILDDYAKKSHDAAGNLGEEKRPFKVVLGNFYTQLTSTELLSKPGVVWFMKDKAVGLAGTDGKTKYADAAEQQKIFAQNANRFKKAVEAAKSKAGEMVTVKEAKKLGLDLLSEIQIASVPTADESMRYAYAMWVVAQEAMFKHEKRLPEYGNWLATGPLSANIKKVGAEFTAEDLRVNTLHSAISDIK